MFLSSSCPIPPSGLFSLLPPMMSPSSLAGPLAFPYIGEVTPSRSEASIHSPLAAAAALLGLPTGDTSSSDHIQVHPDSSEVTGVWGLDDTGDLGRWTYGAWCPRLVVIIKPHVIYLAV